MMQLAPWRAVATLALVVSVLLPSVPRAADAPVPPPPVVARRTHSEYRVERDGRTVQQTEFEIGATNDEAARSIAQQTLPYTVGIERLELVEAYTVKADGRRMPVRPGSVREQLAPGVPSMPMYQDRKQLVIVFPDVAAGDAVAATYRRILEQPLFPGYFSTAHVFTRNLEWQDADIAITLPAGMELTTEMHGVRADPPETGPDGQRTWRWHHKARAVLNEASPIAPIDRVPRIFASTFPDWQTFGRAWGSEVARSAAVTPEVQALADEVTAGTEDKREQARRLYEWVSLRVRWVAIYMAQGGWLPHAADDVLAARYGDCKDQVVLYSALLRAKGIAAEPVAISTQGAYALPGPPTLATFNHVITYLPDWDLYADTTAGGAPFGTLPSFEYGKPVVHAGAEQVSVRRVPALQPGVALSRLRTEAMLDRDGRITGTTSMEATGPYATLLRGSARASQWNGADAFAAQQLRNLGQNGSGSITPDPLDTVGAEYRIAGRFRLDAQPGLAEGDPFLLPPGPALLPPVGEGLLGPASSRYSPAEPTPCYAGVQEEDLSLALPANLRPVRLPRPRRIDEPDFTYESRWSQDGDTVHVHRRLESRLTEVVCTGPRRAAAASGLEAIRRDRQTRLILEEAAEAGKAE